VVSFAGTIQPMVAGDFALNRGDICHHHGFYCGRLGL
jgi:hypothetical protein